MVMRLISRVCSLQDSCALVVMVFASCTISSSGSSGGCSSMETEGQSVALTPSMMGHVAFSSCSYSYIIPTSSTHHRAVSQLLLSQSENQPRGDETLAEPTNQTRRTPIHQSAPNMCTVLIVPPTFVHLTQVTVITRVYSTPIARSQRTCS